MSFKDLTSQLFTGAEETSRVIKSWRKYIHLHVNDIAYKSLGKMFKVVTLQRLFIKNGQSLHPLKKSTVT